MNVDQTQHEIISRPLSAARRTHVGLRIRRAIVVTAALLAVLLLAGGSTLPAEQARWRAVGMITAGLGFDLVDWEANAIGEKIDAYFAQPAAALTPAQAADLVRTFTTRAAEMHWLEAEINRIVSESGGEFAPEAARVQADLEALRAQQQADRQTVEQVIQNQIGEQLKLAGFALAGRAAPPVQFTFTEPPKKLVVSPRDRIDTVYSRMLAPEIGLDVIERSEQAIYDEHGLSGYVTDIGGLGAFPTMVIDRASLSWVLSTVAHEWTHNYLALFPLGWHYFSSGELTTLNETVAEIVGNEIGEAALRAYYPELAPPEAVAIERPPFRGWPENSSAPPPEEPARFDFRAEMRKTRLEVDRLLAEGDVEQAEAYMEQRRQLFVENGYNLRVLNQAYFAFHGSYGTSAASISPIGPKLERLRESAPDLRTFLTTVRSFTSPDELDAALAAWEQSGE